MVLSLCKLTFGQKFSSESILNKCSKDTTVVVGR